MGKMFYTQKFGKKTFHGASTKDAYMNACKWYATNVIAKDKLHNIQVEYIKEKDGNAVTMVLYASMPEKEVMDQHCTCCREMHNSFFINEDTHCERCSAVGFQKRLERKMAVKVNYCKCIIKKIIEECKGV